MAKQRAGFVPGPIALGCAWGTAASLALAIRLWNALVGPTGYGYDAWGHYCYVFFLDLYRGLPYADQSWSYFHPPLHYALGWGLAQFGSADLLLRGLSLVGSAASLGIAALGAVLVRRVLPERPELVLLAFVALAFLPVHLYVSPMPGNELTAAFLGSLALLVGVLNEMRDRPGLGRAALAGAIAAAAILAKTSAAVVAVAILGLLLVRRVREGAQGGWVARAAVLVAMLLVLAGPYYLRNVLEYGTPLPLLHAPELTVQQPPGSRTWQHYVNFSPALFVDARPGEPHVAESVWGTFYLGVWTDLFGVSQQPRFHPRESDRRQLISTLLAVSGVLPTLLAVFGALLCVRRVLDDRRAVAETAMLLLTGAMLLAAIGFTWRAPFNSAAKGSYLLVLSLAYGLFLARALEFLLRRGPRAVAWAAAGSVIAAALLSSALFTSGLLLPRRVESYNVAPVRAYFGEYSEALRTQREFGQFWPGTRGGRAGGYEVLAGIALAAGHAEEARDLYALSIAVGPDPGGSRTRNLAVATALAGDPEEALRVLSRASVRADSVEFLLNRAALRAVAGEWDAAESDLRAALEPDPELEPAWSSLATVLARQGRAGEARDADRKVGHLSGSAPRGYPYGIGGGHPYDAGRGQRWLLRLAPDGLELYRPARARNRPG